VKRTFFGAVVLVFLLAVVFALLLPAKEMLVLPAWVSVSDVFMYKVDEEEATIIGYLGDEAEITIPTEVGGYPVACVTLWASIDWFTPVGTKTKVEHFFFDRAKLVKVTVPEGVKHVSFARYFNLMRVDLPSSLQSISAFAFFDCTSLQSVYFEGNAPQLSRDASWGPAEGFTIYYRRGTTGWTSLWSGYPVKPY